jgi:hypothetical protein
MKTMQDYLNDPRITQDKGLMSGPPELVPIHAARLQIQDETAGMSVQERVDYLNHKAAAILAPMGIKISPGFPGQGKLAARPSATV